MWGPCCRSFWTCHKKWYVPCCCLWQWPCFRIFYSVWKLNWSGCALLRSGKGWQWWLSIWYSFPPLVGKYPRRVASYHNPARKGKWESGGLNPWKKWHFHPVCWMENQKIVETCWTHQPEIIRSSSLVDVGDLLLYTHIHITHDLWLNPQKRHRKRHPFAASSKTAPRLRVWTMLCARPTTWRPREHPKRISSNKPRRHQLSKIIIRIGYCYQSVTNKKRK